ncbi:IS4 family transposase [Candidatus Marinamargulisbacteria bacterium SCGC AG-414-C22]|nr:IS4 family transposase [Candidatus Marinamargulisbacteria bacterium SCGC AG-414-C22]
MHQFSTLLNQLLQLLPQNEFEVAIKSLNADRYVKYFKTKALFVVHLYAQIRKKDSLRDIVCGLEQNKSKWYHIGLQKVKRSTISDSNNRVPYQVYERLFYAMLKKCCHLTQSTTFKFKNPLYALDSSIIDLCLSVFDWAKFRRTKGGLKLHSLYDIKAQIPVFNVITTSNKSDVKVAKETAFPLTPDSIITFDRAYIDFSLFQAYEESTVFFVTRAKDNLRFELLGQQDIPKKKGLQFDQIVQIKNPQQRKKYPGKLRLIGYFDHDSNKTYLFLTNNFKLAAITIAQIYKHRWQIELFFKWIKQHLKIKTFLGTSKNAVLSQIWVAMIYTLLLAYIKFQTKASFSLLNLARKIQESLFFRQHLIDILGLAPPKIQKIPCFTQLNLC